MTLSVYIAGPYRARAALRECAQQITYVGFRSTARWLDGDHEGQPDDAKDADPSERTRWAREDCDDVAAADFLVAFTARSAFALAHPNADPLVPGAPFGASGGRHIETGYALARNKRVLLIGEPENVFHWLPQVFKVEDWPAGVLWLAAQLVQHERDLPRAQAVAL